MTRPLFQLGDVVATPGALQVAERFGVDLCALVTRHVSGDWGDVDPHDAAVNQLALTSGDRGGGRIFSVYGYGSGDSRLWIITEAVDNEGRREVTTVLCPDEY